MGRKKRRKTAFKMVYIPKRVVDGVFFFFLLFWFWFLVLVFNCRVTRVARGVMWVGLGLYTTWRKFALDYRYMLPFY